MCTALSHARRTRCHVFFIGHCVFGSFPFPAERIAKIIDDSISLNMLWFINSIDTLNESHRRCESGQHVGSFDFAHEMVVSFFLNKMTELIKWTKLLMCWNENTFVVFVYLRKNVEIRMFASIKWISKYRPTKTSTHIDSSHWMTMRFFRSENWK